MIFGFAVIDIDDMLIQVEKFYLDTTSVVLRSNFIFDILGRLRLRLSLDQLNMSPTSTLIFRNMN